MDPRYVRDPMLDLAKDLVPIGPCATWACSDTAQALRDLGVPAAVLDDASAWIDDLDRRGRLLYPNVCRDPHDVAEFVTRFVPEGLAVLGVALPADQLAGFLAEQKTLFSQEDGIVQMLDAAEPLVPGYRVLGYQPVSVHLGGLSCSWTCNSLQASVAESTGIVPNEHGFIDTADQAATVMAYLADPKVGKEDGIWRAWLVVRYDSGT